MTFSRYIRRFPHFNDSASVIIFSTKNGSTIIVPETMVGEIEGNRLDREEEKTLTELGFLVESREAERAEMLRFFDELNAGDPVFAAKIIMNLDCNLACSYCFEGSRKGKLYMTRETADLFVDFVEKNALKDREEIRLTFYGGEPLLSVDLIAYVSGKIKALAEDNGLTYTAYIVSNGTLLSPANVKRLKPLGLKEASVTVDGPKEIHDAFRPFKGGKGSFDAIIRNLMEVADLIEVEIGGNFTRGNYRDFPLLLDYLMDNGLTPGRLSGVRFDPVTNETEGIAPPDFHDGCTNLNEPWLIEASIFLREEILRRGFRMHRVVPMPCLLDMEARLIVNYNGDICKCPGLIGREEYKIGDIRTGIKDYRTSHNLDNWKNEECLDCAYLPLCFGGCRYMKLIRYGNIEGVDCRKPFFDAAL
ncbi:MAG: geopeptide radical SAM maturase, partial [Nitrospirota bacterium]|nr:geopeptide radical SAM maturase [Nitrospirota bacterium]